MMASRWAGSVPAMRPITLLVACLALVLAGCGGGDDNGGGSGGGGSSGSSSGNTVTIDMKNIKFAPQNATVKVGQTVKWVNQDTVDHDVQAKSGADFKSDLFGNGKSFDWKADKAGTVSYVCTVHPGMVGTLKVTQ
jgi:plastocyanin